MDVEHFQNFYHRKQYRGGFPYTKSNSILSNNDDLPVMKTPFVKPNFSNGDFMMTPTLQLKQTSFAQAIVSKPNWYKKIKDEKIKEKWCKEASDFITEKMMNYTFDELDYHVKKSENENYGCVIVSPIYSVYQADELIDDKLALNFKQHALILENIPKEQLDWHPGSDNQVLDLVHPSLYPLLYGKSLVSEKEPIKQKEIPMFKWIGTGHENEIIFEKSEFSSKDYQWLPSDIEITKEGKVNFLSYINNLHPYEHKQLYGDISKIFERFVPLFERVIEESPFSPLDILNINMYTLYKDVPKFDGSYNDDASYNQWYHKRKPAIVDFDVTFEPRKLPKVSLKERNLQVIVKMANIHLTPENPKYKGGVWHVEGMKNEDIVATGIYYYDCDNISSSELHFRKSVQSPEYEQDDHKGVDYVYNLHDSEPLVQEIGYISSIEGRCIAFPNIYQHKVFPFELLDKNRSGHRKILVFFLVNPRNKVISTSTVLPQQKDWFLKSLLEYHSFGFIPKELVSLICDFMPFPITLEETKEDRLKLMKERKFVQSQVDVLHYLRNFSLCEH
eukprot:gene5536-9358_t